MFGTPLAELSAELCCVTAYIDSCLRARSGCSLGRTAAEAARLTANGLHTRAVDRSLQMHGG